VACRTPEGFHTITPRIVAEDAQSVVGFLKEVFRATGEFQPDAPSQMKIGDSIVLVSGASARAPFPAFLYVYVDDAEATCNRAVAAGAAWLEPVRDTPYGDRRGMVQDPFGNVWQIAMHGAGRDSASHS
jgi:PhnB protein